MNQPMRSILVAGAALGALLVSEIGLKAVVFQAPAAPVARTISADDCTSAKLGTEIPVGSIGEPVAGVTLAAPKWVAATGNAPAYCSIDGAMAPTDTSSHGRPINFRVILPASWSSHAVQLGGGGMNGSIPGLTGGEAAALLQQGFTAYGSDSGHQQGGFGPPRGGTPAAGTGDDWALSDEAIKNLGYMQMKKTHDAAMVLMERAYGGRPRFILTTTTVSLQTFRS
jgi:feruloyl esterase